MLKPLLKEYNRHLLAHAHKAEQQFRDDDFCMGLHDSFLATLAGLSGAGLQNATHDIELDTPNRTPPKSKLTYFFGAATFAAMAISSATTIHAATPEQPLESHIEAPFIASE